MTALGTNQVIYYRFTDQGVQDNNGRILFSPAKYAAAIEAARVAREREAAQRREAQIRQQQLEQRTGESEIPTQELASFDTKGTGGEANVAKIMDTEVRVFRTVKFRDLQYVEQSQPNYRQKFRVDIFGRSGNGYITFRGAGDLKKFVSTLDEAVRAWKARYPDVDSAQYRGIKDL